MRIGDLERDDHGNLVTKSITGWLTAPAGEVVLLLAFRYVDDPLELKIHKGRSITFVLSPQEGRRLAEELTRQAKRLLEPSGGSDQRPN